MRGVLKSYADAEMTKHGYTLNAANEIEGFVFKGLDAEKNYAETGKFEYVNTGGYYHSLPGDTLRTFIDKAAEVQRAMGFENEKDHPEVAPSQFEINYSYADVVTAADQIQLYKFLCRQVARNMGLTASFLPKPVVGVNGSGMHTNVSVSKGKTEPVLGSEGRGEDQHVCLAVRGQDHQPRQRYLPGVESKRQCLPASRSAFRSAESAQSRPQSIADRWCGYRSETSAAHVSRCGPWRRTRIPTWCSTAYSRRVSTDRFRTFRTFAPPNASCRTTSTTAIENFHNAEWTKTLFSEKVKEHYVELKRAVGGSLPAVARDGGQSSGDSVPSRGLQPVPLESVLDPVLIDWRRSYEACAFFMRRPVSASSASLTSCGRP